MSGTHVLALDLGTGSGRAVLFDREGSQVAVVAHEWLHRAEDGVPGSQSFDPAANWSLLTRCVREVLAAAGLSGDQVAAISTTSMREGIVLFDADGHELWACPNVDARAGVQARELVENGLAQRIYEKAGDWVSITSPARLMWLRDNAPDILKQTSALGMLSDWATFRLCGRHVTEPSTGSSSGMFDLTTRTWSPEIVEWLGLDPSILPEVVDPGTVVGPLSEAAAADIGLVAGTPVVAAGADTQLALVGMGPNDPQVTTVIGGSFWQATSLEPQPVIDPEARLRTLCHSEPGAWMIEGIGFYTGVSMRWYRDAFCDAEVAEAQRRGVSPYVVMEEAAAGVPLGSGGVLAILANVMDTKRWVQAPPSFVQFDLDALPPTGRAHCIRALQEAAAYVTRRHIEIIEEVVGRPMTRVRFTGGASQATLWPQILADVTARPVDVPAVTESTALGAAAYAAVGAGWGTDAATVFPDLGRIDRSYEPSADAVAAYAEHFERWQRVYPRMLDLAEDGLLKPMWWPSGADGPRKPPSSS